MDYILSTDFLHVSNIFENVFYLCGSVAYKAVNVLFGKFSTNSVYRDYSL